MSTGAVIDESALTQRFGGDVSPVRRGIYMRDATDTHCDDEPIVYSNWNGSEWAEFCSSPDRAAQFKYGRSFYQSLPWRGLAADPSGAAK